MTQCGGEDLLRGFRLRYLRAARQVRNRKERVTTVSTFYISQGETGLLRRCQDIFTNENNSGSRITLLTPLQINSVALGFNRGALLLQNLLLKITAGLVGVRAGVVILLEAVSAEIEFPWNAC